MDPVALASRVLDKWFVVALTASMLAGCVTQKTDWKARMGNYTYDQAVTELGPPDKSANLTDGTRVAEWLTHHGYVYSTPNPYPYCSRLYGSPVATVSTGTRVPDWFLRLTFDSNGRLSAWKKFAR